MTPEQQCAILEASAKACGLIIVGSTNYDLLIASEGCRQGYAWNPITNSADTASMCAKLALDTAWGVDDVIVMVPEEEAHEAQYKDHDNSRLKAWMYAATMVAAKIGGYTE